MKHDLDVNRDLVKPKRFKVSKACFTCRIKKIKCDGLQPCMQCKARQRPCSFSKEENEEEQDIHSKPQPSIILSTAINNDTELDLQKTTEILTRLHKLWPGEGKEGKWEIDTTVLIQSTISLIEDDMNSTNLLPNKEIQLQWIHAYYDHSYATFPILQKRIFLNQFHCGHGYLISPLLIFIVMAHGATNKNKQEADQYFFQAKSILLQGNLDSKTSTIIALMLMALYESDENKNYTTYAALAFQMCLDLNLMKDYSYDNNMQKQATSVDIEQRKRIGWGCYVLDKLIHLQPGQPWLLKSKDLDLDMPLFQPGDDVTEHSILEVFVAMIRLLQKAEHILRPVQQQRDHQQNHDLVQWLRSLPSHLQWTPILHSNTPPETPPSSPMSCQLHLLYNLIELHLLKPYVSTSTIKSIQQRSASVASNLTRLTSGNLDMVFHQQFIVYALMESAKFHLRVCACENANLARNARFMFQQSMLGMKNILFFAKTTDVRLSIIQYTKSLDKVIQEADDQHIKLTYTKQPSITMSSTMFVPNLPYVADDMLFYENNMSPDTFQFIKPTIIENHYKSQLPATSSSADFVSQSNANDLMSTLVAQIQNNNPALTTTENDENFLYSLLSDHPIPKNNVGLSIYASAHHHRNNVIKQHIYQKNL